MICPKCGYEIPEGLLLCEKCGYEINIVPDFEPEIENSINETISTIVEEISPVPNDKPINGHSDVADAGKINPKNEILYKDDGIEDNLLSFIINKAGKRGIIIAIGSLAVLVVVLFITCIFLYTKYSSSYQEKKAFENYQNGHYSKALEYVDNLKTLRPNDNSVISQEANIYFAMGDNEKAKNLLTDAINNKKLDFEEKKSLYVSLLNIYVSEEDFKSINDVLVSSNDRRIMDMFPELISLAPSFSVATGNYSEVKDLEISAEYMEMGEIRYTLDGSTPTKDSGFVYSGPISLRPGEYEFNAVYINPYGIVSDVTKSYYLIDLEKPKAPEILPASGTYDEPIILEILYDDENSVVYYTVDGKTPDPEKENTLIYENDITVPVGHFNYCFITVGANGLISDVVKRSYTIDINSNITVDVAKKALIDKLVSVNYIMDSNCTAPGGNGNFKFDYLNVIKINDIYFYAFSEYLNAGINSGKTGNMYAVDVNMGTVSILTDYGNGNYGIIPMG